MTLSYPSIATVNLPCHVLQRLSFWEVLISSSKTPSLVVKTTRSSNRPNKWNRTNPNPKPKPKPKPKTVLIAL